MARKEYEEDDPMILNGVGLPGDTEEAMTDTFIEEFIKMGYADDVILNIFRNPHFTIPHRVLTDRGEPYIHGRIENLRRVWGRIGYRDTEVNHGFSA